MKCLWSDHKRYFGQPLSFTEYSVNHEVLTSKQGFFITKQITFPLYEICKLEEERTLSDRIFNTGTIVVYGKGKEEPIMRLENISYPDKVREVLQFLINQSFSQCWKAGIQ